MAGTLLPLRAWLLAVCCVAPAACAETPADLPTQPGLAVRYYDVNAEEIDLLVAINRASPIREEGKTFHAYTRWVVEWRLHWQMGVLGDCRATSADVSVTGTMTLPRLVSGDKWQERRFNTYITALTEHELGHWRNGRAAAAAVEQALGALPPTEDCSSLSSAANRAAEAVVAHYQQRDREYDDVTEHGRTQGASLRL